MASYVGIDFGTSNSVVAALRGGRPVILENALYEPVTPSVVTLNPGGILTFGREAKNGWIPGRTIRSVKRLLGVEESVRLGDRDYRVEEIATRLFALLRQDAEARLGDSINRVVVTIPANSKGRQRYKTKLCAELARMKVITLLNEPTAAAIAYGIDTQDDRVILVFDFGGGTLDVTVLRTTGSLFEEVASSGIARLGGDDIDAGLADHVLQKYQSQYGPLVLDEDQLMQLRLACEQAKMELTDQTVAYVRALRAGLTHEVPVDVSELNRIVEPLLERSYTAVTDALNLARMSPSSIDTLLLVGGSTMIPYVREFLESRLGKRAEPFGQVDPMTAVAQGAAIASGILQDAPGTEEYVYSVKLEHSLCTDPVDSDMRIRLDPIIERGCDIPYEASRIYAPIVDYQESVLVGIYEGNDYDNPDSEQNAKLFDIEVPIDPPRPRDEAPIEVTFHYDRDGILTVTVRDIKMDKVVDRSSAVRPVGEDMTAKEMVQVAKEVQQEVERSQAVREARWLVNEAREKVLPALEGADADAVAELCSRVEQAIARADLAEVEAAAEALNAHLQQYPYLL